MKVLFLLLWVLSLFATAPYVTSTMTMQELNKLTASDARTSDYFGRSVAISGDTAIVGAYYDDDGGTDSGSAYIYLLNHSTGLFEQTAKLTASDASTNDYFGSSVAISGDIVIMGAYGDDDGGNLSGSAYLFKKPDGGWIDAHETAKLTASDAAASDYFGHSVAISGDTVIVGANQDDVGGGDSGSAYLFEKPLSGGWIDTNQTAKLTASDANTSDNFGVSVAISGDTVIVGANWDDDGGSVSGSAYLFEKPVSGGWIDANQTAKLTASDAAIGDNFGVSVAISGTTVIVGAYGDDDGGSGSGSAYLFEKPLSGWKSDTETVKFTASDAAAEDFFGNSLAISGDRVIVGAYNDDDGGSKSGSAYVFKKPDSGWIDAHETTKLTASDANASDYFGHSVAISGDTVLVGADRDDDGGSNSGSAYIFKYALSENTLENKRDIIDINASDDDGDTISFSIVGGEDASLFDIDISSGLLSFKNPPDFETPGDANGDNIYRVTLKISDNSGESSITQAYIRVSDMFYEGKAPKAISFKELNTLRADNAMDDAYFGYSVAISGDTAVVGAYGQNNSTGNAYIYEYNNSTNLFIQKAQLRASDYATGDRFGCSVAISGDTVIVGAYGGDSGSGSAYIYQRNTATTLFEQVAKLTDSDINTSSFGHSVAISNDTVAVGAYGYYDDSYSHTHIVYIYEKPYAGWVDTNQEDAKLTPSDASKEAIVSSVTIGEDTVIMGVYMGYHWTIQGSAYIYEKPYAGWVNSNQEDAKLTASDGYSGDNFGASVAISNNTVVVGASNGKKIGIVNGAYYPGSVYIYEKPNVGWVDSNQEDAKLTASDASENDYFGRSVAISGNTVIVGAYGNDDSGSDLGSAYLFEKPIGGWATDTETAKLTASDAALDDEFGRSVAISGNTAIVGAYLDDDGGTDSGSAYIFKAKEPLSALPAIIMYLLQ